MELIGESMKKVFLAIILAVPVPGAVFAGDSAIADLALNAPPSGFDDVLLEAPKAVRVSEFSLVNNSNFDACRKIYSKDYTHAYAANRCIEKAPRFSFINNPNFDACYKIYSKGYTHPYAADVCMEKVSGFSFINNPNFDACYKIYSKDYTHPYAADVCMEKVSGFNFTDL
ncbi:MAG: hypothetical protein A2X34_07020 [Elusimicrobia bacterium GWC2_51_8]|nr:MAG: hypothetical protein A2X34_07020 [Elusimicrobia bacterium GWC2_51_8]